MQKIRFLLAIFLLIFFSCSHEENQAVFSKVEMCTSDLININSDLATKPNAAIINWPRWTTGQTIRIKFLDGDAVAHEKVKRIANEWTNYANLKFEYVPANEYADIRIGFNIGNFGVWSFLGMKSAYGNTEEQSMRLGPLTSADETSVRRTILHEFGHALGLVHETTNPAANINWNLPKTYDYFGLQGWSKDQIDEYVIKKSNSTNYSTYDPLSIMHYYIPASITTDGKSVNEMSMLSDVDKKSINEWYPFPIKSIVESGERIDRISWTQPKSPNGQYKLDFMAGFLFITDLKNNEIIWSVGNPIYRNSSCFLQKDGNIVIKGSSGTVPAIITTIWTSNTSKCPGATLHLQNDGNLQLIYNGIVKWSSKIGGN